MAVNTPIVATDVGDMRIVLNEFPNSVCNVDDVNDMSKKIIKQIQLKIDKKLDYRKKAQQFTWKQLSDKMLHILERI
jgi:glycosyltransferase involved in cell wall biosynthesis